MKIQQNCFSINKYFEKINLGYFEGVLSIILNTILFILKIWVGIQSKSISMIADAWHTISDSLTSLVVIVGFSVAAKPKDEQHPFGHGRAEVIAAIIIGTLLAVVGFNFIVDSIKNLINKISAHFSITSIIVFVFSSIFKELLASFSIWAGKKINSKSLVADGWHHRSDAFASFIIVLAAIFGKFIWWIDGILGIIVSILILWTSFDIAKGASNLLLGEKPDESLTKRIEDIIYGVSEEISDIHHIHIHRYGDHLEITLHIRMNGIKDINYAHDIANAIEKKIREELKAETTIHIEPQK
ncbi:MAG: cation diffusion facilitator family transporter [Spirochaetes bacterium]|nr:cation diffusion facilitator family transporter [Spirochaetota bacterium]